MEMQGQQQITFPNNEGESNNQCSSINSTISGNGINKTEGEKKKRSRTTYSKKQLSCLENSFKKNQYISKSRLFKMSKILALSEKQIKVWFQNRRTKQRKEAEKDQFTTRSAESIMTTPPYALNTHQLNNTTQSSMWVIPNATSVSNIYFNNVPPNYFTTLNYKNIGHSQQEREQNYYQPAIESVAPAQQMQSSYNVLQNDMSSPYNQYGSYQTDSGTISCSQLQQETYNYQQPWYNYPNAQNNVQFFNESSHIDNNDYAYNNVAQNNYTYNNSVINESFNEKISFS